MRGCVPKLRKVPPASKLCSALVSSTQENPVYLMKITALLRWRGFSIECALRARGIDWLAGWAAGFVRTAGCIEYRFALALYAAGRPSFVFRPAGYTVRGGLFVPCPLRRAGTGRYRFAGRLRLRTLIPVLLFAAA